MVLSDGATLIQPTNLMMSVTREALLPPEKEGEEQPSQGEPFDDYY